MKLGISGVCGKMGMRILHLANEDPSCDVVVGLESADHPDVGKSQGIAITCDLKDVEKCECFIEFTSPQATLDHLDYFVKYKVPVVIGTTGLKTDEGTMIEQAAKSIPIVYSPNMSVGVNILFKLLKDAAAALSGYSVAIEEAHHIHKKDSPSGTAKKIAQVINDQGFSIRTPDISAIREGEIIGDHKVTFESDVDKIELFHSAKTRDIFAKGAITAAKWLINKQPGLYSMQNVLFDSN
ncbi:MAG: 4-hydroxy-tetrahydrodipicolinate reductase [Candidatus Omnitrophica bacterium]|nr:4-hydroxy-tetrahydrodipicolinate reductase [Candidatus Omnitrophota bacterium]